MSHARRDRSPLPSLGWIGIAEIEAERGKSVAEKISADFVTTDTGTLINTISRTVDYHQGTERPDC